MTELKYPATSESAGQRGRFIAAAILLVTLAAMLAPMRSTGATAPEVREQLLLLDQALRLRVARNDLSAAEADAELQRRAAELASRESAAGQDPAVVAEHRRETAAFFAQVEQAIGSASSWPADQPPDTYKTQATKQLERARLDYREALREDLNPLDALRLGQQVLAWARGEKDVPADRDVFAGAEARVTAALEAARTAGGSPPSNSPAVVLRDGAKPADAGAPPPPPVTNETPPSVAFRPPPLENATPAAVTREDANAPATGVALPEMVKVEQPAVVLHPTGPGAGTTAPENDPTYMPKDEALAHRQKAGEAEDIETQIKEYHEALRIEPRYAPWWGNLGDILGEHGRWQESEAAFKRAVELNPKEPEYHAGLALALLRLGRKDEAVKEGQTARALAREQKNDVHGSHPVYAELSLPKEEPLPTAPSAPAAPPPAAGQVQKSYRGIKFSVAGLKRVKEFEGTQAGAGNEIVVVSTVIDRSGFKGDDFRGNECKLDRAKLRDAAGEVYKSAESQRRVTAPLRNEDGTLAGSQQLPHDWSFEVPEGAGVKTFELVFADERINTGGADPDEDVTELSFDLE